MSQKLKSKVTTSEALRRLALQLPMAEEGIACAGTALEKRTIKAGSKAFLFLGATDAMLKLSDSLAEAEKYAVQEPESCKVGAHGWVTAKIGGARGAVPLDVLQRWTLESYGLLAPRKLASTKTAAARPGSKRR